MAEQFTHPDGVVVPFWMFDVGMSANALMVWGRLASYADEHGELTTASWAKLVSITRIGGDDLTLALRILVGIGALSMEQPDKSVPRRYTLHRERQTFALPAA